MAEVGRPTEYGPEVLEKAREYAELPFPYLDEVLPSIEGLALYIGVSRSTIYAWKGQEGKEEFSDILERVSALQGKTLINKGLSGDFTSTITKVMLTKHGYREGLEQTGADGKDLIPQEEKKAIKEALKAVFSPKST